MCNETEGDRRGRVAAAALASQAAWRRQRGGRSSPASQPTASDFIGSTAKAIFSVRPHVEHSKVRSSEPRSPAEIRAKAILCLHTGHIGRSCGDLMRLAPAVEVQSTQDRRAVSIAIGTQASRTNWSGGPRENAGLCGLAPSPLAPKAEPRPAPWSLVRSSAGADRKFMDGCGEY
jgi:hypothetical protein